MASFLAGSLAKQIGRAFNNIFLPCTLTRGATVYPCKAIFEKWGKRFGGKYLLTANDYTVLVLATSLAVEPDAGDYIVVQGTSCIVGSNSNKPAVSRDPAIACWTLLCKPETIDAIDWPRLITIKRPASVSTPGLAAYQGATIAAETTIASGIMCSILIQSAGRTSLGGALPDDSPKVEWTILIPTNGIINLPMINETDRVYDDLGRRFMVSAYEPQALSARLDCVRLES